MGAPGLDFETWGPSGKCRRTNLKVPFVREPSFSAEGVSFVSTLPDTNLISPYPAASGEQSANFDIFS
jgi:hypothetical protein